MTDNEQRQIRMFCIVFVVALTLVMLLAALSTLGLSIHG